MIQTRVVSGAVLLAALAAVSVPATGADLTLKVTPQADGTFVPVSVALPKGAAEAGVFRMVCAGKKDAAIYGQIVAGDKGPELHWVIPQVSTGQETTWTASPARADGSVKTFTLKDTPGRHLDTLYCGRIVTRYMYANDTSNATKAHETYKVYNHVFDAEGKEPITKGAGGKYTHHRGIFIGWSRVKAGGQGMDTWHMKNCRIEHQKILAQTAGPALARTTTLIHWNDKAGKAFLAEQRQITVYAQVAPAIVLLDFRTRLTATEGEVTLSGDPEHAGCQYRPHNDVASHGRKADKLTKYMFYKESIKGKGQFEKDMPWVCMSYWLREVRYNVQHMSHPMIPKGNTYSAYRDYGRFGAWVPTKVPAGGTLELRYRYYVGVGDLPDRAVPTARYAAFTTPPKVEIVK